MVAVLAAPNDGTARPRVPFACHVRLDDSALAVAIAALVSALAALGVNYSTNGA